MEAPQPLWHGPAEPPEQQRDQGYYPPQGWYGDHEQPTHYGDQPYPQPAEPASQPDDEGYTYGFGGYPHQSGQSGQPGYPDQSGYPGYPGQPSYPAYEQGQDAGYRHDGYDYADFPEQPQPRKKGKTLLLSGALTLVLVLAVAGAFVGYRALASGSGPEPAPPSPTKSTRAVSTKPATPTGKPTLDLAKLNSKKTDPKPMTLAEAFPSKQLDYKGKRYERVVQKEVTDCSKAGRNGFGQVLVDNGCAKVLRATYVDASQEYVVTAGVAVLPTKAAADKVIGGMVTGEGVWFEALPGDEGSGAGKIHRSPGYGAHANVGRYVIFAFAAMSDGSNPEKAGEELSVASDGFRKYVARQIRQRARAG